MLNKEDVLQKLKKAAEAYYNNEISELTDEEYDQLSQYAEEQGWLIQDNLINDGVNIANSTINHKIPMLSLSKAKSLNELIAFLKRIDKETKKENLFRIEPKLDGLAITLRYDNGILQGAYTRGTGTQGEDASYIIDNKELEIFNIIKKVDSIISEIRGELVCSKENLIYNSKNRGENFKNERIAAAGLLKKAQLGLGYKAKLDFVAYSAYNIYGEEIQIPKEVYSAKDDFPMDTFTVNDDINSLLNQANSKRELYKYPTDGIVIKMTAPVNLGETSHHPLNSIAYKYPGESKVTKLIDIKWGTGKTGRLTPIGILEPTTLGGVTINNVSLNNIDWIKDRDIKIGSLVELTRANDVIPYIKKVIMNDKESKDVVQPTYCPYCNAKLTKNGAYLECNNHNCPATVKNRIRQYVSKNCLDIEGMNEALIDVLPLKNVKDILELDLSTLEYAQYSNGTSLGKIRASEIYNNIQKAKSNTDYYIWLTTLEIPLLGKQTAKALIDYFSDIDIILKASKSDLTVVNGIGEQMANTIVSYKDHALNIWNSIKSIISINKAVQHGKGVTFCITGTPPIPYKNRNEYVKAMEDKGYIFHSSIRKDTQFLVTNDFNSTSSKLKKAKELGIHIVKELE